MDKIKVEEILTEDYILKYYWDEQLLDFDLKRYHKRHYGDDGNYYRIVGMSSSFFTIVLDKKVIYHGLVRIALPDVPLGDEYFRKDCPAIIEIEKNTIDTIILALQPYNNGSLLFRYFDEKEQKKILNQEVLKYFEKKGKIIRGEKDLNEILGY